MPSSTRDKDATWCSPGTLCRQLGWTKRRLIYELQNGLPCQTVPPGHEHKLDWHDPTQQDSFDLEASEVTLIEMAPPGSGVMGWDELIVGIEVLPPSDAVPERKPKPKRKPKRKPAKKISLAAMERCFRDIMRKRPDDPPDEESLLAAMKTRLGASPGRQRVRNLWREIAPQWKRPVGHPRNNISAKNSAT